MWVDYLLEKFDHYQPIPQYGYDGAPFGMFKHGSRNDPYQTTKVDEQHAEILEGLRKEVEIFRKMALSQSKEIKGFKETQDSLKGQL